MSNPKWEFFIFHLTWENNQLLLINPTQPWCCLPSTADHPASSHLTQRHSLLPSNCLQHHCPPVSMATESIDPRCVCVLGPGRPWPSHLPLSMNLDYGTSIYWELRDMCSTIDNNVSDTPNPNPTPPHTNRPACAHQSVWRADMRGAFKRFFRGSRF